MVQKYDCVIHRFQFLYGLLAGTSQLGSGMSLGYSAVALPKLQDSNGEETLTIIGDNATWFASMIAVAIPLGSIISLATMRAGRRIALTSASVVSTLGWILIACSYNTPQLLIGRFITGLATGMASTPGAVYIAEITTPNLTAVLTSVTSVFINVGIMLVYLLGFVIENNWRLIAALSSVPTIISALGMVIFLPESPRWLLTKGRDKEAKRALLKVRGLKTETDRLAEEFAAMIKYRNRKNGLEMSTDHVQPIGTNPTNGKNKSSARSLLEGFKFTSEILRIPEVWKPLAILNAFFFFQQFCGVYVIVAYSVDVVTRSGVTLDAYAITFVIGLIQIMGSILLICCSTRVGRRPAALFSGIGMSVSMAVLATYIQFLKSDVLSAIPLTCILVFVGSGSLGFTVLPWSMIGEIYPTRFVNVLGPLTTCFAGLYNFAAVQMYPSFVAFNSTVPFYFYCGVSIAATIFIALLLPETNGKSKSEIEDSFKSSS